MNLAFREKQILRHIARVVLRELHPKRIVLFGSRARRHHPPGADFDIAVDGRKPPLRTERKLREAIDQHLGLHGIDLVFLADVDKDFRAHILKTGRILYEKPS